LSKSQSIWIKLGVDGEQGLAEALRLMGLVAFSSEGNYTTAQAFFEKSLTLHRKHGNQWGMALVMAHLGWIAGGRNDEALALSLSEQSLDLFRQLGDLWGIGRVSQALGEFFLKQGNYEKARFFFEQHLRIDEGLHFKEGTVVALGNIGNLNRHQGDYEKAEQYYEQSLSMCREYSIKIVRGVNWFSLGMLLTMAVGDGANDLDMLADAGNGVAYHAKPLVARTARARIDHADLTALLYLQGYRGDEIIR
jgi:tetratricopeptide (TPR) repeat protein